MGFVYGIEFVETFFFIIPLVGVFLSQNFVDPYLLDLILDMYFEMGKKQNIIVL